MSLKLSEPLDGLKFVSWSKLIHIGSKVKQQNRNYFDDLGT